MHFDTANTTIAPAKPGPDPRGDVMKYACFRFSKCFSFVVSLLLLNAVAGNAQQRATTRLPAADQQPASDVREMKRPNADGMLADVNKDYLISAGDVVEVWIEDAPELSRSYRVNAAGEFPMDVVGRVSAKQKTTEELAQHIATRLRAEEFLVKPNVVVTVRQYNSQTFIVQGAISRPGVFQLEGRPKLLDLIGLAGGLTDNHGSAAFILRRKTPLMPNSPETTQAADTQAGQAAEKTDSEPAFTKQSAEASASANEESDDYELIKVNLAALYKGHFEHNRTLEPRDIVHIPRADVFFINGEVNMPGSYQLKEGTTLRQAISMAQGMHFKAKPDRGVIFREDPDTGKRQEIKIDFAEVMNGKREDILILANDVIIVPNSRMKSISAALLSALGTNAARIPVRY